jgi:uncharacterized protein YcfJ
MSKPVAMRAAAGGGFRSKTGTAISRSFYVFPIRFAESQSVFCNTVRQGSAIKEHKVHGILSEIALGSRSAKADKRRGHGRQAHRTLTRLILLAVLTTAAQAAPAPLNLKWNDLGGAIVQKHIVVNLRNGSQVRTIATSVEPGMLIVRDHAPIPRDEIAGLWLVRTRKRGRILGVSLGALAGLLVGGGVAVAGSGPAGVAIMIAAPIAGYYIGKRWDGQEIPITILPD